jgi:hypothetical protein
MPSKHFYQFFQLAAKFEYLLKGSFENHKNDSMFQNLKRVGGKVIHKTKSFPNTRKLTKWRSQWKQERNKSAEGNPEQNIHIKCRILDRQKDTIVCKALSSYLRVFVGGGWYDRLPALFVCVWLFRWLRCGQAQA